MTAWKIFHQGELLASCDKEVDQIFKERKWNFKISPSHRLKWISEPPRLPEEKTKGAGSLVPAPLGPLGGSCAIPYERENIHFRPHRHYAIA